MIDPFAAGADALARRAATAPWLVFAAGVASSVGPCVAPRFVAIAACVAESRRPGWVVAAFLGGLIGAYASFGCAVAWLGSAQTYASPIYAAVAVALLAGGFATLAGARCGAHPAPQRRAARSLGGVTLLGASFAFVVSPCCTPFVAMILAYTSLAGAPLYGAALCATFALGHALPVAVCGILGGTVAERFRRIALHQAVSVVSGALMLALGGYYALLI